MVSIAVMQSFIQSSAIILESVVLEMMWDFSPLISWKPPANAASSHDWLLEIEVSQVGHLVRFSFITGVLQPLQKANTNTNLKFFCDWLKHLRSCRSHVNKCKGEYTQLDKFTQHRECCSAWPNPILSSQIAIRRSGHCYKYPKQRCSRTRLIYYYHIQLRFIWVVWWIKPIKLS